MVANVTGYDHQKVCSSDQQCSMSSHVTLQCTKYGQKPQACPKHWVCTIKVSTRFHYLHNFTKPYKSMLEFDYWHIPTPLSFVLDCFGKQPAPSSSRCVIYPRGTAANSPIPGGQTVTARTMQLKVLVVLLGLITATLLSGMGWGLH